MQLTGKAKEDFLEWCKNQTDLSLGVQIPNTIGGVVFHLNSNPEILPKRILNNLIVDFFDSVGMYIVPLVRNVENKYNFSYDIQVQADRLTIFLEWFLQRQQSIEKGIIKANEIYNNNNK